MHACRSRSRRPYVQSLEARRLLVSTLFDPAFGKGDGELQFDFSTTFPTSYPFAVAVDAAGAIYVAGDARPSSGSGGGAAVAKFLADGTPDPSFGVNGKAVLAAGSDSSFSGIALQPDGKVVAVGYDAFVLGQALVARFNTDGTLDTSFDSDGYRTLGGSGPDKATTVRILPDQKILVGGSYDISRTDLGVYRLNANGSSDATYNGTGLARFDFYAGNDALRDMAVLPGGSVVGVGTAFLSGRGAGAAIVKFSPTGTLDTSFASSGYQDFYSTFGVGSFDSIKLLPDGKLLAAGIKANEPFVVRFNDNGSLDTSFGGGDGWVDFPGMFENLAPRLELVGDGTAVVSATMTASGGSAIYRPALIHMNANGTLNNAFGSSGVFTLQSPLSANTRSVDVVIDTKGRIVLAGSNFGDNMLFRLGTAGVTASLADGVLVIEGTDNPDTIRLRNNFAGQILVETSAQTFSFPFSAVAAIQVDLKDGADTLIVRQALSRPVTVVGGDGVDLLDVETSNGDDNASLTHRRILGGGNDVTFDATVDTVSLRAMDGYDTITIDLSLATGGSFTVVGDNGNDTFRLDAPVGNGATLLMTDGHGVDTLQLGAGVRDVVTVNSTLNTLRFTNTTGSAQFTSIETLTGLNGPRVTAKTFEFETQQAIAFSYENLRPLSVDLADLVIQNLDTGATHTPGIVNTTGGTWEQSSLWRSFSSTSNGVLPDGRYRATVAAGRLLDVLGNANPAPITIDFHVLAGDANRDRKVDFDDLLILAQSYGQSGKTFSQGNFNYSAGGNVDFDDLLILAQRYGTSVAAIVEPVKPTTPAKKRDGLRVLE